MGAFRVTLKRLNMNVQRQIMPIKPGSSGLLVRKKIAKRTIIDDGVD